MTEQEKKALIRYRMTCAHETLREVVDVQIKNGAWNTAVNRLYYACYYAVTALLVNVDIHTKTHAGAIKMFAQYYLRPGRISEETGVFYGRIFDMRQGADYEDFLDFLEEDVIDLVEPAKALIAEAAKILLTT